MRKFNGFFIAFVFFALSTLCPPVVGQCPAAGYVGTTDYNHMGYSVASMFDGIEYFVGGAPWNDDIGSDAGKVVLFESSDWYSPTKELFGETAGDNFGHSVACNEDVHLSSGWPLIFVGAPYHDNNGVDAGRAYVFSIESGVTTPVKTMNGISEGWNLGFSVAVGNLDNDEYPDFVAGAPGSDNSGVDAGAVRIFWNEPTSATNIFGEAAGDQFGYAVTVVGDINDDGYNDFAVGAPFHTGTYSQAGRVYIYNGYNRTLIRTHDGEAENNRFGCAIDGAGDVNQDGYDDIIIGAYTHSAHDWYTGRAYVYSGYDGALLYTFTGEHYYDYFGLSVAGGADLNMDGVPDLVVGAERFESEGGLNDDYGRVYAFSGTDGSLLWTIDGAEGSHLGFSVSTMNIFRGYLLVGAIHFDDVTHPGLYEGALILYSGHGTNPTGDFVGEYDAGFGNAMCGTGDIQDDGHEDFIIGSSRYVDPVSGDTTGAAYVYSGIDSSLQYLVVGEHNGDKFGYSVAGGGDLNGDGYDDFVIAAPYSDGAGSGRGGVYAYSGLNGLPLYGMISGIYDYETFGWSIDIIGDFNGDTYPDLLIGAPYNDENANNAGAMYIRSGIDGTPISYALGWVDDGRFGISACGVGNFDGNSTVDYAVGEDHWSGSDPGRVFLWDGYAIRCTISGENDDDLFGSTVSSAGDMNGDGYDDLMVLASRYSIWNGYYYEDVGRVYVFLGDPGIPSTLSAADADIIITGDVSESVEIVEIAGVGDFNGDGYDDIGLGIPGRFLNLEGSVLLFYGNAGTYPISLEYTDADSVIIGIESMDGFGYRIAGAGDTDGDGAADVLVAANYNKSYCKDQNQAYLHLGDPCCDTPGDANNDGLCNIGDEVFLGNFIFRSDRCEINPPIGCPPECGPKGDANGDGSINVADEVYLGNFIFRPPPVSPLPVCGPAK